MVDLRSTYMDLDLRSPVVASASPATASLDRIRSLGDAGIGAVVLPSLFEEQLEHDLTAAPLWFADLDRYNSGPEHYLNLVEQAAGADLGIPVIASLNGSSSATLIRYARQLDEAGADAIELNLYHVPSGFRRPASEIEDEYVDLVAAVRTAIDLPLAVKIGPWFTALAHVGRRLAVAGAGGLVLFNRFFQPDIDVDAISVVPHLSLSTPEDLLLPLSWIRTLFNEVPASLAASSGVHTSADVIKVLLAGGQVAMMASALLDRGVPVVGDVITGVRDWLALHGFESVSEIVGRLSAPAVSEAESGDEQRAAYLHTITSYSA